LHENLTSLMRKQNQRTTATTSSSLDVLSAHQQKRMRYAMNGFFWKFEAFDVKPMESMPRGIGGTAIEASSAATSVEERIPERGDEGKGKGTGNGNGNGNGKEKRNDADAVRIDARASKTLLRPLTSPIFLNVPTVQKRTETSMNDSDSESEEEGWARFEDERKKEKKCAAPEGTIDPFAELAFLSHASSSIPSPSLGIQRPSLGIRSPSLGIRSPSPETLPQTSGMSSPSPGVPSPSPGSLPGPPPARAPLDEEFPGADISFDLLSLGDDADTPGRRTADASFPNEKPETREKDPSSETSVFDAIRAFEFDFSSYAFDPPKTEAWVVDADADADAEEVLAVRGVDAAIDDADVSIRSPRLPSEPSDLKGLEKRFSPDDWEVDPAADSAACSSPRPARDPELEEWSAACRAWPWLAEETHASRDETRDD